MTARAFAFSAVLLILTAPAAFGQDADFERVLAEARASWDRGDAEALAALADGHGLFITVDSRSFGPLGSRHAAALLRQIFERLGTATLERKSVQVVRGAQPRGYGEFAWSTDGAQAATVFLGLVRERRGWRLTEIRISIPGW